MTIYTPDKVYLTNTTFSSSSVVNVDLSGTEFVNGQASGAFYTRQTLKSCKNIANSTRNCSSMFYNCYNLTVPPSIPENVVTLLSGFAGCNNMITGPDLSNNYTLANMRGTFQNCSNLTYMKSFGHIGGEMSYAFENCFQLNSIPTYIPYGTIISTDVLLP